MGWNKKTRNVRFEPYSRKKTHKKQGKNCKATAVERLRDTRTQSSMKQKQMCHRTREKKRNSALLLTAAASPAVKTLKLEKVFTAKVIKGH